MLDTDIDLPPSFWTSRLFIVTLTLCVTLLLLSAYVFLLRKPPLIISEKTTRITGPLTADGEIDFFKALEQRFYPPELATDDNGFRDFVRLFGNVSDDATGPDREFYRLQKYEKLGLDPNVPPTLALPFEPHTVVNNFYKAKGEPVPTKPFSFSSGNPWTFDEFPMLEEWIRDVDVPLNAIAEAVRKPIFYVPLRQSRESVESGKPEALLNVLLPDIQLSRSIARMFQARATFRIGQGNIDGAIDDKLTIHRLGRHTTHQSGFMVQYLVGIANEGGAVAIPVGANPECPLTETQIRRLLDGLDALPPRAAIADAFEGERYFGLSCIQGVARRDAKFSELTGGGPGFDALFAPLAFSCNWNVVYRRMNEIYDAMQEPPPRTKFHSLVGAAALSPTTGIFLSLLTPHGRGDRVADILIDRLTPATDAFEEAARRSNCTENMQRLALAILLYQLEHGQLPDENWATQIEKYLGDNPQRYFSCPSNPSPDGETTYALVLYDNRDGDTVAGSLLLVELTSPVPLDKAVVSVDDVLRRKGIGSLHPGGMNTAHRSTAVRFLAKTATEELEQLLERKSKSTEEE